METQIRIRRIFTVIIHNKEYDVYDIEGKEHEGYNDMPKTWWLYYSDRLPEGLFPSIDSDCWKPFCKGTERRLWDIRIVQKNTTKEKWGETQFSNHTNVEMWCNGKLIYSFGTYGTSFALAKVQYLQTILAEHVFNFFEPEKMEGRKIWWYGLPASIKLKSHPGEIAIIPDYTAGLNKEEWWKELKRRESKINALPDEFDEMDKENFEEAKQSDYINWGDALSDQHINWFR